MPAQRGDDVAAGTSERVPDGITDGIDDRPRLAHTEFLFLQCRNQDEFLEARCHFPRRSDPRRNRFHHEAITAVTSPAERVQSCQVVSRELVPGP